MRHYDTGATRDSADDKPDYVGYFSSAVIRRYGEYMLKHQRQADGEMRSADNWKRGIPREDYLSSAFRHLLDVWVEHEGGDSREGIEDALCGVIFNAMGYLHEELSDREYVRKRLTYEWYGDYRTPVELLSGVTQLRDIDDEG